MFDMDMFDRKTLFPFSKVVSLVIRMDIKNRLSYP